MYLQIMYTQVQVKDQLSKRTKNSWAIYNVDDVFYYIIRPSQKYFFHFYKSIKKKKIITSTEYTFILEKNRSTTRINVIEIHTIATARYNQYPSYRANNHKIYRHHYQENAGLFPSRVYYSGDRQPTQTPHHGVKVLPTVWDKEWRSECEGNEREEETVPKLTSV